MSETTPKVAQSPELIDEVEASFNAAKPLMRFLCKAVGVPY